MTKKILLLLTAFSLFLTTNTVNALDVASENTNVEDQKITIDDVKKFIPDSIELDIKSSDLFDENLINEVDATQYSTVISDKIGPVIEKKFRDNLQFEKETVTTNINGSNNTYEQENFLVNNVKMYYDLIVEDVYSATVVVYERKAPDYYYCTTDEECREKDIEKTVQFKKNITLKYTDSDQYNEEDQKYVQNIINSSIFKDASNYFESIDCEWNKLIKDSIDKLRNTLNDSTLKIYNSGTSGCSGDGDFAACGVGVAIARNSVVYELASINVVSFNTIIIPAEIADTDEAYINYALPKLKELWKEYTIKNVSKYNDDIEIVEGTKIKNNGTLYKLSLEGGNCSNEECFARVILKKENTKKVIDNVIINNNSNIQVTGSNINKDDEIYTEMLNKAKERGFNNVFGSYEFKIVNGKISDKLAITFTLGNEYNGKYALVLHKKADGNYEEFNKTVENGQVTIEVSELSPFMILLSDSQPVNKTPNNAQTSSLNITLYSVIAIGSLLGIAYIVIRNKKKES